jgi:cytosine/creatinine deaminase
MYDLVIRNIRLFEGPFQSGLMDLAIEDGHIVERGQHLAGSAKDELSLDGELVIPGFVESHLHLDIALMNSFQVPGREEPYLSHYGLNDTLERRRKEFSEEDIITRAGKAVEMALRHGVTAIRAQCHVDPQAKFRHLNALLAVKEQNKERMFIQLVGFPQQGLLQHKGTLDLFREAFKLGLDVMGCAPNLDRGVSYKEHIDAALELAVELDVELDAHVDLGIPWEIDWEDLEITYLARRTKDRNYAGRVTAGHVCALGSIKPEYVGKVFELIKAAGVNIISQPDMYRLGRDDRQHVRRGLTRVKELLAAGINVAFASNNVRDVLRPMGNFDLLEEGLILAYGAHMDTVSELEAILKMCTYNAARILSLPSYGLDVGNKADLVVLNASSPSSAIVDQAEKRYVIKSGRVAVVNTHQNMPGLA